MEHYIKSSSISLALELHDAKLKEAEILSLSAGMEGHFASALGAAIKDIGRSVVRTIGSNMRYWNDTFKRSEFRQYYDANSSRIGLFLKDVSRPLPDVPVPTPEGMSGTYPVTIESLLDLYKSCQLLSFLKEVAVIISPLVDGIDDGITPKVATAIKEYEPSAKAKEIEAKLKELLSGRRMAAKLTSEVFAGKESIQTCIDGVVQFNGAFHDVLDVKVAADGVNTQFDKIITALEKREAEYDRATLQAAYNLISGVAVYIDHFGALAHEMQRVEHNFTAALKIIMRTA